MALTFALAGILTARSTRAKYSFGTFTLNKELETGLSLVYF